MDTNDSNRLKDIYDFSIDILDKRYDSYHWCEGKINTLVTVNGLLLGALFIMIDKILCSSFFVVYLGLCIILLLTISLCFSLIHIIPKMNSGRTSGKNIRTIIGTEKYNSNSEYNCEYLKLDINNMIELNTEQIRAMNANIMKSQRQIKFASICSILGVILFLYLFIKLIFNF